MANDDDGADVEIKMETTSMPATPSTRSWQTYARFADLHHDKPALNEYRKYIKEFLESDIGNIVDVDINCWPAYNTISVHMNAAYDTIAIGILKVGETDKTTLPHYTLWAQFITIDNTIIKSIDVDRKSSNVNKQLITIGDIYTTQINANLWPVSCITLFTHSVEKKLNFPTISEFFQIGWGNIISTVGWGTLITSYGTIIFRLSKSNLHDLQNTKYPFDHFTVLMSDLNKEINKLLTKSTNKIRLSKLIRIYCVYGFDIFISFISEEAIDPLIFINKDEFNVEAISAFTYAKYEKEDSMRSPIYCSLYNLKIAAEYHKQKQQGQLQGQEGRSPSDPVQGRSPSDPVQGLRPSDPVQGLRPSDPAITPEPMIIEDPMKHMTLDEIIARIMSFRSSSA